MMLFHRICCVHPEHCHNYISFAPERQFVDWQHMTELSCRAVYGKLSGNAKGNIIHLLILPFDPIL